MERSIGGSVRAVGVLDKAVGILDALSDGPKTLAELARALDVPKPTVHRLCSSLESHGVVARLGDRRIIGPRVAHWQAAVHDGFEDRLVVLAEPVLERLRDETGESVQLYVRDGGVRRCIAGLESLHGLRTIVEVGAQLPLDAGSAGAVFLDGRSDHWVQSVEEREKGVASVSAAVMSDGAVVAVVSVSGPLDRTGRSPGRRYGAAVERAARSLSNALS